MIPADCLVMDDSVISTDESGLTGEPEEMKKSRERDCFLLSSCLITEGTSCKAMVFGIGIHSQWGKIKSNLVTVDETIISLEKLKLSSSSKVKKSNSVEKQSEYTYGNLPPDYYKSLGNTEISKWDDGYTILNTDKWQVPMPRPPVCINNSPCKVCPNNDDSYPVQLSQWDNSRKVSNIEISKDWANKQVDPKT
jgi:hypothetical protein